MSDRPARPLLTVKQLIPPVRVGAVPRERLERLLRAAETRLTVVVAPAGWGKTCLLSGWAADAAEQGCIAWVSLDEGDDEPLLFWSYVLTALCGAGVDPGPLKALAVAAADPMDLALPMLLNELAASSVQRVLVLDDYHLLTDRRIHEAVEFLVAYLPASLRLVVAGRADPPLPLARLRARGELTELRAADLRFSPDEAAALLSTVSGADLDTGATAAVWERTEGWAAGLQLAALRLRGSTEPNTVAAQVRGDDRHLLDYFAAEVLPGLAPRQRELLVRAAPLERLSGSLCDAALQVQGSAEVLAELVHADLFVAALDGEREWYRCHRLLRDALLRVPRNGSDAGVLGRAAVWFAEQGRTDDAVRHLLRAGDDDVAADMLYRNAESWFFARGAAATYLQLGEQLPDRVVGPQLAISLAFASAMCGRQDRVTHWLETCESKLAPDTVIPGWHNARAAVLCLSAVFGTADSETGRAVALAGEAVELEAEGGADGNPTVRSALASALARDGRLDEGASMLAELWHTRAAQNWPSWVTLQAAGILSFCLVELGRSAEFERLMREIRPLADAVEREWAEASALMVAGLRITEGRHRYLAGHVEEAATLLRRAVAAAEAHSRPMMVVMGYVYLADAELGAGHRAAARSALSRAREIVDEEPVARLAMERLADAEVRLGRGAARVAARSGALAEELTDRELSILRMLPGSASQREIGGALFLSINTVKAYNKSLYRKLGVASRQDAVAVARGVGLI
jgi:LuxR family transcriptional regulator, maltose regulon positive regulatory protein